MRLRPHGLCLAALLLAACLPARAVAPYYWHPYETDFGPERSKDMVFYPEGRRDYLFGPADPVVLWCQPLQQAIRADWQLCRNLLKTPLLIGSALPEFDNSFRLAVPSEGLPPGFYDLHVTLKLTETQKLTARTCFGWRADEQPVVMVKPPDFAQFWQRAYATIQAVPLDLKCAPYKTFKGAEIDQYCLQESFMPEHYDPEGEKHQEVEVYSVDFATVSGRVYGWFAKPPGPGPFPALCIVPGAGNSHRPIPLEQARHGYAALDVNIHGERVDLPNDQYGRSPNPSATMPEETWDYRLCLNALQSFRAVRELPAVDPARVIMAGQSQGGRLTVVVSALEPRVRAAVATIPHYAYLPYQRWAKAMNDKGDPGAAGPTREAVGLDVPLSAYFDVLNFADQVRCPLLMNLGLVDGVSPPPTVYAVYSRLAGPKQLLVMPNLGHRWNNAFDRWAWRWLAGVLAPPG